jgi:hypothetical protein
MFFLFFLRRRTKKMMAPMRARPRRGPMTTPAIQALDVPLFLLVAPLADEEGWGIAKAGEVSVTVI